MLFNKFLSGQVIKYSAQPCLPFQEQEGKSVTLQKCIINKIIVVIELATQTTEFLLGNQMRNRIKQLECPRHCGPYYYISTIIHDYVNNFNDQIKTYTITCKSTEHEL